jgi:hypothetical protein
MHGDRWSCACGTHRTSTLKCKKCGAKRSDIAKEVIATEIDKATPEPTRPYHGQDCPTIKRDDPRLNPSGYLAEVRLDVPCDNSWTCPRIREWVQECNRLESMNKNSIASAHVYRLPPRPTLDQHTHWRKHWKLVKLKPATLKKLRDLAIFREFCPLHRQSA